MPEPIFMKLGMYILAPEPILNLTLCVCVCVCVRARARARVCVLPSVPLNFFVFFAVRVVSKESRRLVLPQLLVHNAALCEIFQVKSNIATSRMCLSYQSCL
jgi:hypothetical protein